MKRLPENLRKNGFSYTLVLRGKRSCIYRQEVTVNMHYYEAFVIKVKPAKEIFGKSLPEREVFPANEDFGESAWSCRTLKRAKIRFIELEGGKESE